MWYMVTLMVDLKERREIIIELYNSVHSQIVSNEVNGVIWQRKLLTDALIPATELKQLKGNVAQAEKNKISLTKTLAILEEFIKKEDESTAKH